MTGKQMGRPPVGDVFQRVAMTTEQKDDLKMVAALLGISRAEAIRRSLVLGLRQLKRSAS